MNLGNIRLRVGQVLNVAGGGTATSGNELTLLDAYANEAVEQVLLRTKVNKKTAEVALTVDVGDYVLDPIMLAFDDAWVESATSTGFSPMIDYVDSFDIRAMRNTQATIGTPTRYAAYEGNVIMLYPNPGTGDMLHIVYVPRPTAMTSSSHDPSIAPYGEIPLEFHEVIESYVKWKMADYADDASSQVGSKYEADFERGILRMKSVLIRKAGVRTGHARVGMPGRYSRFAPPGVDTGR